MEKNRLLLGILNASATIGFYFLLLFSLWILGCDVFTKDGKIGSSETITHHSKGYYLNFTSHLSIPDSTVYQYGKTNYYRGESEEYIKKMEEINRKFHSNRPSEIKEERNVTLNRISTYDDITHKDGTVSFIPIEQQQFQIYPQSTLNCSFPVKSSKSYINWLLMLKTYFGMFALLIVFYQLMCIFRHLLRDFSFTQNISKRVNLIGLFLILSEISNLTISYIVGHKLSFLQILSIENKLRLANNYNLNFNPKLDFDIVIFGVGLSLLILSSLLKMGSNIEKENNLTI